MVQTLANAKVGERNLQRTSHNSGRTVLRWACSSIAVFGLVWVLPLFLPMDPLAAQRAFLKKNIIIFF